MRIIGGQFRSRRLQSDKSGQVRPTSGTLREALFNIIGPRIEGARVLDVCAGTGAVGLEALSRGAQHTTFIEHSKSTLKVLKANIATLDVESISHVIPSDAIRTCERLASQNRQFDVIFVDPPYYQRGQPRPALSEQLLHILDRGLLSPKGRLFIEEGSELSLDVGELNTLRLVDSRSYGDAVLFSFEVKDGL